MSSEITTMFSDRLNFLVYYKCNKKPIRMSQIAREIGIEKWSLSKYLNEQAEPGITALYIIANYFNVSADFLLGIENVSSRYEIILHCMEITGLSLNAIRKLSSMEDSEKKCICNLLGGK